MRLGPLRLCRLHATLCAAFRTAVLTSAERTLHRAVTAQVTMTGTDDKTRAVAPAGAAAEAAGPGGAPVRLFDAARLGKLVVCIAGIYVFFVLWAVLQERGASCGAHAWPRRGVGQWLAR